MGQQSRQESSEPWAAALTAYVLHRPGLDRLRVAGMGLVERWRAAFTRVGARVVEVDARGLLEALTRAEGPALVADGGSVAEQAVVDLLTGETPDDAGAVAPASGGLPDAPLALLGPEAARRLGATQGWTEPWGLLQQLRRDESTTLRTVEAADLFWRTVSTPAEARSAGWRMLRRLRLRPGGLAARHINRHVSTVISYFLTKTPLTPNMVTMFTLASGLLSAWLVYPGGYWAAVAGAAMMQLSSIVDGCDGEVALVRYMQSEWGGWFDSIADEIVNALFLAAVGHNLYVTLGHWAWLVLGILSGAVSFLYALFHWHCKWRHGVGLYWWFDQQKLDTGTTKQEVWESKSLMRYIKMLLWRDSFLLAYLLAAASWYLLPVLLVISGGGAVATLVMLFIHVVIKRGRW